MDEILLPDVPVQDPAASALTGITGRLEQLRAKLTELRTKRDDLLFRWDAYKQGRRLPATHFLAAALALGVLTTAFTVYTTGYAVSVDGQELGVVSDIAQFEAIETRVEDRVSQVLGHEYTMDSHVSYRWRVVDKRELSSMAGFETYLFNQVNEVTRGYVLTLGGETVAVQSNGQELEALLNDLKAPYINENTIEVGFTTPVEVHYEYVDVRQISNDLSAVTALLTSNTVEAATYTVKSGDTASAIAQAHDMSLDDLMAMNPGVNRDRLSIDQELTVRQNVPFLGVRTVEQVTYQVSVDPPVEYRDDPNMYQRETKVLDPGATGTNLLTAKVTYISGMEQERDIIDTQVITQPKTKIVARGTKPRPKTMPNGYFIWPASGPISSGYGGRSLYGTYNFHGGIDIYVPTGTSVKAADGGTVVTSGWHGSYGYYIVIDHGNGFQTYYAHNSRLLVGVGEKVFQGQIIAKSGSTGNVTGPHCHFEVRINGQRTNPRSYLP